MTSPRPLQGPACSHWASLERAYVAADAAALAELAPHLERCAVCRRAYDVLFDAESMLVTSEHALGATTEPTDAARAAAPDRLLGPLEKSLLLHQILPDATPQRDAMDAVGRWRRPLVSWLAGAATIALLAAMLLHYGVGSRGRGGQRSDGMQSRGAGGSSEPAALPDVGLRPLCIASARQDADAAAAPQRARVRALGTQPLAGEPPRCTTRDLLGFAAFNHGDRPVYLTLVVATGDHTRVAKLLYPADDAPAEPLAAARDNIALAVAQPLAALGAGRVDIVGVFTRRELTAAERQRLRRAVERRSDLADPALFAPSVGAARFFRAAVIIGE
ncbi:MAG: hypothetical protein KC503_03085 [Myxococcales bacterium]|nr:hypothetical protein [Myxococcales bacterium]